jgi:hypothetical protein
LIPSVSFDVERPAGSGTAWPQSTWPATVVALGFLGLSVAVGPHFLEVAGILSLHRWRPVAYGLQLLFGALTVGTVLGRTSVNSQFHRVFPTRREFCIAVVIILFSLSVGLIAMEGLARVLQLPFRVKWTASETPLARFDPELGWSYIPNQSVTQEFGLDHRKVVMNFDDLGCRVANLGDRADRSAPTALFVGDSIPFGHGVAYEDSFVGRLASRPDFPLQVVNLGVQAYGTDQSLLLLKRQFKRFNTKLVVFVFTANQIGRNEVYDRRIQFPDGLFLGTKPMFALKRDGSLYLAKTAVEFNRYSYSHLWAALKVMHTRWGPKPDIRLTRALIQEMKRYVESNGARFVVVDWYDDQDFPWGLDVDLIRVGASLPPEWSDWIIPGETHPDARANLYASEFIAKELKSILTKQGR